MKYCLVRCLTRLRLIGISKTTHTTHDAEDVIVNSEDLNNTCAKAVKVVKAEDSVINTREVASAAGLMFFGVKCKRIEVNVLFVNTCCANSVSVVFVTLNTAEVFHTAFLEAVLTVELEDSAGTRVSSVKFKGCKLGRVSC